MGNSEAQIARLERYTHFLQNTTLSLGTLVITALAYDRVQSEVRLGNSTVLLFLAALGCFLIAGITGGHVAAQIAEFDETEPSDINQRITSLVTIGRKGLISMPLRSWRSLQHWSLLVAVILACGGGLVVVDRGEPPAKSAALSSRNGT